MNNSEQLCQQLGIDVPLICGAMYPCSNPELVAAASEAGAIGIVQPMSLSYVHGHDYAEGLKYIGSLTDKPIGVNLILETSSKIYQERTRRWAEQSAEAGVRLFITALGNPDWVVRLAEEHGITVYHDVTNRRFAEKALDGGVDGFICVNNRAGGHAGKIDPAGLFEEISVLGKPVVCAGGIGSPSQFRAMLDLGYAGAQAGTRFIATTECSAHADYKQAIIEAGEADIVLTDKISGVPVSIIKTPYIESIGTEAGPIARRLLKHRRGKHLMRTIYSLLSIYKLKKASVSGSGYKDYWQAGKSAGGIERIKSVAEVVKEFQLAL